VDELKNEVARKDSALQELEGQCSKDVELLRERISSLESEIRHLRETSDLNLKKLEKAENELVKKDWYLSHLDHEKTKQLDAAKQNINALEKEVASYARRNTDLKAEIRSLKNHDEDQTITLMRGEEPRLVKVINPVTRQLFCHSSLFVIRRL
jgi:chromosome segregation ATPase